MTYTDQLGRPDICIAGLCVWIHCRQFPDSKDYWDVNWLNVSVRCGASGSSVIVNGSIIHLSEISFLLSGLEQLYKNLSGKANLECMEPELSIELEAENGGHIKMTVDITPDHTKQQHRYEFEIDQSYLPKIISECKAALEKFPIIGKPS